MRSFTDVNNAKLELCRVETRTRARESKLRGSGLNDVKSGLYSMP
jgi:hypothetical protein